MNAPLPYIKKRPPTRISPKQYYLLCEYVKEKYVAEGKTDRDFATMAALALNFPIVEAHVATAREVFKIPSTRDIRREENKKTALINLAALAERIAHLEACARHYGIFEIPSDIAARARFPVDSKEAP